MEVGEMTWTDRLAQCKEWQSHVEAEQIDSIPTAGNHPDDNPYLEGEEQGKFDEWNRQYAVAVAAQSGLERIARLLAEQSAPVIDGTYANGHDWCLLCGGEGEAVAAHDADCPWRLAKELAEVKS